MTPPTDPLIIHIPVFFICRTACYDRQTLWLREEIRLETTLIITTVTEAVSGESFLWKLYLIILTIKQLNTTFEALIDKKS